MKSKLSVQEVYFGSVHAVKSDKAYTGEEPASEIVEDMLEDYANPKGKMMSFTSATLLAHLVQQDVIGSIDVLEEKTKGEKFTFGDLLDRKHSLAKSDFTADHASSISGRLESQGNVLIKKYKRPEHPNMKQYFDPKASPDLMEDVINLLGEQGPTGTDIANATKNLVIADQIEHLRSIDLI